jgi:hypothetical protein
MSKSKCLSKRQLAVLEDLFIGELDEPEVLEKHGIHPQHFEQWFAKGSFRRQFEQRITRAYRESRLILARCAPLAAAKLVALTDCEKEETARKACLDIIALQASTIPRTPTEMPMTTPPKEGLPALTPETASRLLAALAKEPPESGAGN